MINRLNKLLNISYKAELVGLYVEHLAQEFIANNGVYFVMLRR